MTSRYLLRFETGERRGEEIPIEGPRVRLGRRKLNEVRIVDPSVSGEHAELVLEADGAMLADCGSTNGTRVAGRRIEKAEVRVGEVFALGNVKLRLLGVGGALAEAGLEREDGEPLLEGFDDEPADEPAAGGAANRGSDLPAQALPAALRPGSVVPSELAHTAVLGAEELGGGVGRISTSAVEDSGKRSAVTWVVMVLVIAAGGVAAWMKFGGEAVSERVATPPAEVPGNLLTAGSFEARAGESEGVSWEAHTEPPVPLTTDELWRNTGLFGAGVELVGGEWSAARSASVRVRAREPILVSAWMSVEGDVGARLGLRLENSAGSATPLDVWGPVVRATAGFEQREWTFRVPAAFDRASVMVGAGSAGSADTSGLVALDDVALVQDGVGAPPGASVGSFDLVFAGRPGIRGYLVHIDRVLLADLRCARPGATRAEFFAGAGDGSFTVRTTDVGLRLELSDVPSRASLVTRVDPELVSGGIATTGAAGHRAHTAGFEEVAADSVLLGTGLDLVRLVFPSPVLVRGRPGALGYELEVGVPTERSFDLQLSFTFDRDEAQQLARSAREAEAAGHLGEAHALWGELLVTYPFEAELVREAKGSRVRLHTAGMQEVQELKLAVDRSHFFGLAELSRRLRNRALDVAERYAGTEVETKSRTLASEIEVELTELDARNRSDRRGRLEAIAQYLSDAAPQLAEQVRREAQEAQEAPVAGEGSH